jgi:hypothetical protein
VRPSFELQLCFEADWDRIESVRQAVKLCVFASFGEVAFRDALAMVSSELLENGVKYGKAGAPIRLSVTQGVDDVRIVVTNEVEAGSAHTETLRERVAWVASFATPRDAYEAALATAYEDENAAGGLGIVRIAHEGGCVVQCDASTSSRVVMTARYALSTPAAPRLP